MAFAFDASAAANIVNKNCNPEAVSCQRDVERKFSRDKEPRSPGREAAMAQCYAEFNECRAANGGIQQNSGRIAQRYHPANPDFIECRKTISDPSSDDFTDCMVSRTKPKREVAEKAPPIVEVVAPARPCSKTFPRSCKTGPECLASNGTWDGSKCKEAQCPEGTTQDKDKPEYCNCNNAAAGIVIEAGTQQKCPSSCLAADNKFYDPLARGCACNEGFEDRAGTGRCVSKTAPPPPTSVECLREFQEKVTSCNSSASTAVDKCDPNRSSGGDDSLGVLQNLLGGVAGSVQAKNAGSGAMDNCMNAAIASSSGYYALEEMRGTCDGEITTCKTSCSDATSYINANKDRVFQLCRRKAFEDNANSTNFPYNGVSENVFNADWERMHKPELESQVQQMQTNITDNKTKCDSGTAVSNRDQISNFMDDMNSSVKSANQCQCQLGSGSSGSDCAKQAGPAECAANPSLAGCVSATANCLNPNDISAKCVCFRNPNSNDCKTAQLAAAKVNPTEVSGFAGGGSTAAGSNLGGDSSSGKTEAGGDIAGDLSGLNADGEFASSASGSATTDGGSPFGAAAGGGASGGGSAGGGASADGATTAGGGGDDEGTGKKLGGLFDVAKSALGNLFKGKAGDKGSFDGVNKNGSNFSDTNGLDSKKWRPRGMVRGLAGDTELAGKFEDIWKVMNKQYKVQDQKDTFIFGGGTK